MLKKISGLIFLCLACFSVSANAEITQREIDAVKNQLQFAKSETTDESAQLAKNLEGQLSFLSRASKQQEEITELEHLMKQAPQQLAELQANIKKLTEQIEENVNDFSNLTSEEIEQKQEKINQELQQLQTNLNETSSNLAIYRSSSEQSRKKVNDNNLQIDKLTRWKYNNQASKSLIDKYNAEIKYLELNNRYNVMIGQNVDILISVDEAKKTELTLQQQRLYQQITSLQDVLNEYRIKEYEAQAKQAEDLKANNKGGNPVIEGELDSNTKYSQYLVEQTKKANNLSQESLRAKNVLDSLVQTQHNIEEQISALQGTLVLSRIINQQKQSLPTESLVKGLSKDIAKLRVEIFELSQKRDELYNLQNAILKLEDQYKVTLTEDEKQTLEGVLKEREKILIDLVKTLNNKLNLSNEIESIQKQIIAISDSLQSKLQQQSFWVQSNNPIDLSWLEEFPQLAIVEIAELAKYIGFDNVGQNLPSTLLFLFILLVFYGLIRWKKTTIKARLVVIANQVNTLKNDSHWHTPEAMFWTIILCLPSTLMFLIVATTLSFLFFVDPLSAAEWVLSMSFYWLFFATVLSLLRPNGLAYRHFGMPKESNRIFQRIIRESVWIVVLLFVSSIFAEVEIIGFTNDVIGQVVTIIALALCTFVVRPLLNRGIQEYEKAKKEDGSTRSVSLFKLLRFVLFIVPLTLIVLIFLGYYYTAVYLIDHIIKSYLIALVWVFGRYFAYRSLTISSRRMAYRRLQNKREKIREQAQAQEQPKEDEKENTIKISTVNEQIFRIADLVGWVVLIVSLYAVWSDLIGIANYLNTFVLWEHIETTAKGTVVESVTLLNILRTIMYITITYVLVKNIKGILEVTFFSRVRFSKGTPHTITAVLTYFIVTFGSISAFTALGISWSKIQWIFTALSVGLGFGVREIFGSFVSGTILLFERPIRVGDKVTVGNFSGVITRIRLRSTTLIDDDNKEVVLPNQAFVTDRFINWTLNNTITRLQIGLKVNSGVDLNVVRELLLQAAREAPKVIADPSPKVNLLSFGEGWIEHELNVYVSELDDRAETRTFLYQRIDQLFNEHHIQIAFNQLNVHLLSNNTTKKEAIWQVTA